MARDDVRRALSNRRKDIEFIHESTARNLLYIYEQLANRLQKGGLSDVLQADTITALRRINRELQQRLPGNHELSRELQQHADSLSIVRHRNGNGLRRNGNRGKRSRRNGR